LEIRHILQYKISKDIPISLPLFVGYAPITPLSDCCDATTLWISVRTHFIIHRYFISRVRAISGYTYACYYLWLQRKRFVSGRRRVLLH